MLRILMLVAAVLLATPVEARSSKSCWQQVERLARNAEKAHRASQARKYERQASRLAKRCKSRQRPSQGDTEGVREAPLPPVGDIPVVGPFLEAVRAFLDQTALAGATMEIQGKDIAIGWLNPKFAERLARAVAEARAEGIEVGVFSGYRKPVLGVGGYKDKSLSCHAYGLAVDVYGVGRPKSATSRRWYVIATKNGLYNPYGPNHRVEWNHYQALPQKGCGRLPQLRKTITRAGPDDLQVMWDTGWLYMERALNYVQRGADKRRTNGGG